MDQQEALSAERLERGLGRRVRCLAVTGSTNAVARAAVREGSLGPGGLVVAEAQEAGRGRLGRSWSSEPGKNLLFSLILPMEMPPQLAARAVLVWAAAMAERTGLWLKWPNDLVDEADHKVGGILAETESGPGGERRLVLGVGLNVNQVDFPGLPLVRSLALLHGGPLDRNSLLIELVQAIEAVDPADPSGLDRWRARARTLGRRVRVGDREGLATGLREDGALLIEGHPVLAGDVELVGGAG